MTDFDKLLANLRLGTEDLSKDVDKAVAQIDKLNKKAGTIDEALAGGSSGSSNSNLKKLTQELLEVSKNMTKVSEDVAKKYEATAKRVKTAQVSMTESLKHNVETNKQSMDEAYKSAKKYHEELSKQYNTEMKSNWGKEMNAKRYNKPVSDYNPYDTDATQRQLMGVEKFISELETKMAKAKADLAKQATGDLATDLKNKRAITYAEDLNGYRVHLQGLLESDKLNADQRLVVEKELVDAKKAISKETENAVNENTRKEKALLQEKVKESKAILSKAFELEQTEYKENLGEFKTYCKSLLASDKLTTEDRIKLRKKLSDIEDTEAKDRKKQVTDQMKLDKKATDELNKQLKAKQPTVDKNSPVQKFDNITNYAFDAGIIYGAVNGVKKLTEEVKNLELGMTNLQRVAPNLDNFQISEVTDGIMDIASGTNNTVTNVQEIANYWVRVSDEIANSTELLTYLTDVTSTAMNVGGFSSADEAVQLLSASVNQMGLEWEDAGSILDGWMKIADTTAVGSAKDLADMVLRTGTQAKMLGMDINQLNAIMGIFANNMAKDGEEAGTAMKTVFSYFTDTQAIDTLYKHGVMVMKNAEEYRNFADVMVDLQAKYKELEAEGNEVAIREMNNALGRTRRVDYVGTLINNFDQFNGLVMQSADSIGYAGEQNEKMMGTVEAKLNELSVAFTRLAKGMGDAGILEDLGFMLTLAKSGMDAVNNMDASTKRFILTIAELMTVYTLAQKASKLLWGAEMTHMIANAVAKVAIATQSQTLLNLAVSSGANVKAVSAVAETAETGAVTANTIAKGLNNQETVERIVLGTAEIAQSGGQVIANGAESASYVALAQAKMGATATGGLLTSAMTAMLNPVGLAIGALGILTAVIMANKKAKEEDRLETERYASAQATLAEKLNKANDPTAVVEGFEADAMQKDAGKIEGAITGYENASKAVEDLTVKHKALSEQLNSQSADGYNAMSGDLYDELSKVTEEMESAKREAEGYSSELLEMGSSTATAKDDIASLEAIIARSTDTEYRSAMGLVNKIKAMQEQNVETRSLISQYESLSSITNRSIEESAEYDRVIQVLSATFPSLSITADDATGAISANTQVMRDSIGITGQLTNAQFNEVLSMANVSENAKTLALNQINAEIKKTTTVIDQAQIRIDAYQAEAKAMGATNTSRIQVQSSAHKPLSVTAFGKEMMSNKLIGGGYSNDSFAKTSTVKKVQDLSANIASTQRALASAEAELRTLEARKNAVSKVVPTIAHDTSAGKKAYVPEYVAKASKDAEADREKAQREAEQARDEAQRALEELAREAERLMQERERTVLDMQGKIVNALKNKYSEDRDNRVKALKEMEEAEVKVLDERVTKLRKEIEELQDTRKDERDNLASLKNNLKLWKADNSEYGKRKVRELEKQIAEQEKDLLIDEKERAIDAIEQEKQAVQDAYDARLDSSSEQYDSQLKVLDNAMKEVNLYKEANALLNGNATAQAQILELLKQYVPEYGTIGQLMGQSLADAMMAEVTDAMDAVTGLRATGTTETPAGSTGGSTTAPTTPSTPAPTPAPAPVTSAPVSTNSAPPVRRGYSSKGENLKPNSSLVDYMKSKGYYSGFTDRKNIYGYYTSKGILNGNYKGTQSQNDALWARLKKDGFDTGGYTGEWGSQGKLAMLHQKERVLNAPQTKAFESLVYDFLPKVNVGKPLDTIGKNASTIINNNAPMIQNDIQITNNTPFDVNNKMDNLNRAIKSELQQIGYKRSIGGRR